MLSLISVLTLIPNIFLGYNIAPYGDYQNSARIFYTAPQSVSTSSYDGTKLLNLNLTCKFSADLSYNSHEDYVITNITYTIDGNGVVYNADGSTFRSYALITRSYVLEGVFDQNTYFDDLLPSIFYSGFIDDDGEMTVGFYDEDMQSLGSTSITGYSTISCNSSQKLINYYADDFTFSVVNFIKSRELANVSDDISSAYSQGYTAGFTDGSADTGEASVIFSGILSVALLPVNFFLGMLNFEVFGINIGGMVSGLLTLAIVFILCRTIFSGGNGSNDK